MQTVDVGEGVPITTTWWDKNGNGAEPSAIALTITKPDGTVIAKTKVDMTVGATTAEWVYSQTADQAGLWRVEAVGTVGASTVEQTSMFLAGVDTAPTGPCEPWCTWEEVEACGAIAGDVSPAARELAIDQASEILWDLTGRVYSGICTKTRSLCFACATCYPTWCGCDPVNGIDLNTTAPVWGAWDVVLDGVTLAPSAYTVRSHRWLVRTDDNGWPTGWDTADPDAFRVTWAYGRQVPVGGRRAAAMFARQIAMLCVGDGACELPQLTTSITREGVTYTILDAQNAIKEGRTRIAMVDLWVIADREGRKPRPGMFMPAAASVRKV